VTHNGCCFWIEHSNLIQVPCTVEKPVDAYKVVAAIITGYSILRNKKLDRFTLK
jgi:hypothetical protein